MTSELIAKEYFYCVEETVIPRRPAKFGPIPKSLHSDVKALLKRACPLYGHQASALETLLDGGDICIATSTASGKSLVFIVAALHLLCDASDSTVLALYPAKALVNDQFNKWQSWGKKLDIAVGFVHGGVHIGERPEILKRSRIVLMTPDVAHAWLLANIASDATIRKFMSHLRLLILDEAHVYEGVFGSNMAYFLRRLQAVSGRHQMVITTATLGEPKEFAKRLTGRTMAVLSAQHDCSASAEKKIQVLTDVGPDSFQALVAQIRRLAEQPQCRFLAFADSRRMVEQLVVAVNRGDGSPEAQDEEREDLPEGDSSSQTVLPYRSGYEDQDRRDIQHALDEGRLAGVVSTSALELGLDIGALDVVLMLCLPPTVKAFWQRLGRVGRKNRGTCLIIDSGDLVRGIYGGIENYLMRPVEPSWLYLDNRYIQYTNALCAAQELGGGNASQVEESCFTSLPQQFRKFLENELDPTENLPYDLLSLKQRADANSPQKEFPIRAGLEQSFRVTTAQGGPTPLGTLTYSQVLREAYPGAVYYYMARSYRVCRYSPRKGTIEVVSSKQYRTNPISQTKVFPDFSGGSLNIFTCDIGFVAEAEMQVSERVLGFKEQRGPNETEMLYDHQSPYWRTPLTRYFMTTGVCLHFPQVPTLSHAASSAILHAYCLTFGIEPRDLGIGYFHSKKSPVSSDGPIAGMAVYDATDGSLRLSQRLAKHFHEVIQAAVTLAASNDAHATCSVEELKRISQNMGTLEPITVVGQDKGGVTPEDTALVIAPGEQAMYYGAAAPVEVTVINYLYTPQGLRYRVHHWQQDGAAVVNADLIQPIPGATTMLRVNLLTGEEEEA